MLAQHARLLGGLGARGLGVELEGGQPALEILELLCRRFRLLLRRRALEVESIAPVGKRGGRRAERMHAGEGRHTERRQGACKGKGSSSRADRTGRGPRVTPGRSRPHSPDEGGTHVMREAIT